MFKMPLYPHSAEKSQQEVGLSVSVDVSPFYRSRPGDANGEDIDTVVSGAGPPPPVCVQLVMTPVRSPESGQLARDFSAGARVYRARD